MNLTNLGTVTYESLTFPENHWKDNCDIEILTAELPGCEHRETPSTEVFFETVLVPYLCTMTKDTRLFMRHQDSSEKSIIFGPKKKGSPVHSFVKQTKSHSVPKQERCPRSPPMICSSDKVSPRTHKELPEIPARISPRSAASSPPPATTSAAILKPQPSLAASSESETETDAEPEIESDLEGDDKAQSTESEGESSLTESSSKLRKSRKLRCEDKCCKKASKLVDDIRLTAASNVRKIFKPLPPSPRSSMGGSSRPNPETGSDDNHSYSLKPALISPLSKSTDDNPPLSPPELNYGDFEDRKHKTLPKKLNVAKRQTNEVLSGGRTSPRRSSSTSPRTRSTEDNSGLSTTTTTSSNGTTSTTTTATSTTTTTTTLPTIISMTTTTLTPTTATSSPPLQKHVRHQPTNPLLRASKHDTPTTSKS